MVFYHNKIIFSLILNHCCSSLIGTDPFLSYTFTSADNFDCPGYYELLCNLTLSHVKFSGCQVLFFRFLYILITVPLTSFKLSCASYIFHHIIELTVFQTFHYYVHINIGQNAVSLLLCIMNRTSC
jgi:hypothetical protein